MRRDGSAAPSMRRASAGRKPLRLRHARTGSAATPARPRCARPPPRPARAKRSTATPRTIRRARTISRRACARHSARCASACACAAPRRCFRGSACCVYGLTFTSHFYGARRTVGYVPFNSETLVTGKLFEDIREAVFKLADPALYDADRHHQSVRADRLGRAAAASAQGDQRRPHHRHRRAGLRRADPRRSQGRAGRRDAANTPASEAEQGPVQAPRGRPRPKSRRSRCSARCFRPTRSGSA